MDVNHFSVISRTSKVVRGERFGSNTYSTCPRGVMGKALGCGIVVSEFVLQSRYYVHLRANTPGKDMNPVIFPAMGYIVPLLFF